MMEAISFDARHLSDSDWNNNRQLLGWSWQTPGQLTCLFVWLVVWPHALERSLSTSMRLSPRGWQFRTTCQPSDPSMEVIEAE